MVDAQILPSILLLIWQSDKYYKPYEEEEPIRAEWNSFPDLILMDMKAKKAIAIECKFRSNGLLTIDHDHYMNYKRAETQISAYFGVETEVFVMAGTNEFEGTSQYPDYMFCIPIDCFKDGKEKELKSFKEYLVMDRFNTFATKPILDNIHF